MGEAKATRVPSIGRIVHYQSVVGKAPAIVVKVHSPTMVNLRVFSDDSREVEHKTSVAQGEGANTWNWPEQV